MLQDGSTFSCWPVKQKEYPSCFVERNIDSSAPTGKLMLTMIGAIAEFERANIPERQREGIEIARQPAKVNKELFETTYEQYITRKIYRIQFEAKINVTRPTLDKLIRAYENKTIAEKNNNYYVNPLINSNLF